MNKIYLILGLFLIFLSLNISFAEDNGTVEIKTDNLVKYYQNDTQFEFHISQDNQSVSNGVVNLNINGQSYNRTTDHDGYGKLSINLNPGNYSIITSFKNVSVKNNISVLSFLSADDLVKYYKNDSQYYCKVLDNRGLLLKNASITFNINGVFYTRNTNSSGIAKLNINLNPGDYIITATFNNLSISNKITVLTVMQSNDLNKYYKNSSQYLIKILDNHGDALVNTDVLMNIHGVFYTRTTNSSGIAQLNINLKPGNYIITSYFNNLALSNNIIVLERLFSSDISSTYGNPVEFSLYVLDGSGNPLTDSLVTFNIGGIIYSNKTDGNGHTGVNLNHNAGNYLITYTVDNITGSNSYVVKNAYSLTNYQWNSGANVLRNSLIKNNVVDSDIVSQMITLANSGTPMVTFKGGEGKKVFITAGVHGNELSSQVAAMNLIKYLQDTPIDGTVYIMPFVQPKATAGNVRNYNGVNLNSVANVAGSISNKIVELIVAFKCDSYGDFHCTRPNGDPGANVAMGSYAPTYESATISKYIAGKCNVKSLIYSRAASEYPGALEDTVNLRGIPAVTCEVLTPHGTIAGGSVEKSLSMMKALLSYNKCI